MQPTGGIAMDMLKKLTLKPFSNQKPDPIMFKRQKLVKRLEDQKQLLENPAYLVTEQKWLVNDEGIKVLVDKQRRIKRWWRTEVTGDVSFTIRYGQKIIELEKGKGSISLSSKDDLPETIDLIIAATKQGELDHLLVKMGLARGIPSKKPAAKSLN
jgi:hypothetical protein